MLRKMLTQPVKYMTLDGTPVGYPSPLRQMLRADFMGAALAFAATTAFPNAGPWQQRLAGVTLGYGICKLLNKDHKKYLTKLFGEKIITTRPTEIEKINSMKYSPLAKAQSKIHLVEAALAGTIDNAMIGLSFATAHPAPSYPVAMVTIWVSTSLAESYRFRKVAKGDWAIIDEPPKEKLLEHFKSEKRDTSRLPAPQTA